MIIESGTVVTLSLTVQHAEETLQCFPTGEPTAYLHGYNNLVPTLEAELEGLQVGESFDLLIEDAYGEGSESEPQAVPKREFPRSWNLQPGTAFFANGSDGQQVQLFVHQARGSRVYVSSAHPWAGKTIHFTGEILHVRNASDDERQHGHAHGPGGHGH